MSLNQKRLLATFAYIQLGIVKSVELYTIVYTIVLMRSLRIFFNIPCALPPSIPSVVWPSLYVPRHLSPLRS